MTTLNRALALDERNDGAVAVAEQLHLDVPRVEDAAFEVDGGIAERRLRLGARRANGARQFPGARDDAHPFAAAAGDGLDHDWIADALGDAGDRRIRHVGTERLLGSRPHPPP